VAGVIDLEVDEREGAVALFERLFAGEPPPTLGWRSARGEHRLYRWDDQLEGLTTSAVVYLAGGAVELRLGGRGKQVVAVCPPSPNGGGGRREWNGIWEISSLPERSLEELASLKACRVPSRAGPRPAVSSRYAAAALAREAELVREAEPGARNRTLNRAAYCLGQLVAAGVLERGTVEAELADAAVATGLLEKEIIVTLRSGLEAGLRKPRTVGDRG
jgi:Bifunctional DNA primase/polymerase, N-terminal